MVGITARRGQPIGYWWRGRVDAANWRRDEMSLNVRSVGTLVKNVASKGSLRQVCAKEPQRRWTYVRIPSTAGTQNAERSTFSPAG